MLVAKRHFVNRQHILAMAITFTEARGGDLRPNYPRRAAVISGAAGAREWLAPLSQYVVPA
jgi:hypothetical protein